MKKRLLSLVLAVIMVIGIFPTMAFAATDIPEGAIFTDVKSDAGESVTVTKMEDHYKVEVPYGTTVAEVVYPEGVVRDNGFGYAMTKMVGFEGVYDDGYLMDTYKGETTVMLAMEKWPANGAPFLMKLLNVPYDENPRMVGICKKDGTVDYFAFTYKLGEGEYFAELTEGTGYTITGKPIASDGYTFSVSIDEGFETNEYFAVKINGETISTEPGEYTVEKVTENIKITVTGVQKAIKDTDIAFIIDLTEYDGPVNGMLNYITQSYEMAELNLEAGRRNVLALEASKNMIIEGYMSGLSSLVIGYIVNGTEYPIPTEYTGYEVAHGVSMNLDGNGYFRISTGNTTPVVVTVKPIVATAESVGAAPAFEEDCIKVTDISVLGADVVTAEWEGDSLNVELAEGTPENAILKTLWTIYAKNEKEGASQPIFAINDRMQTPMGAEVTFQWTCGIKLENGSATAIAAFSTVNVPWDPSSALDFTPKTFTVNFSIHSHSYEAVVTEPTCTEGGYTTYICSCGDSYIADETEVTGHDYGEWSVAVPATTEREGVMRRYCENCGAHSDRIIPKLASPEEKEDETNPNTGAPVFELAIAGIAIFAISSAAIEKKNRR